MFEKENFSLWSIKMKIFLKSLGLDVFASITNAFDANTFKIWSINAYKSFEADGKARFAIMHAFSNDDISCIIDSSSAFDMWNLLVSKYETNNGVSSSCMISSKNKKKKEKKRKNKERKEKEILSVIDESSPTCLVAQDVDSCEVNSQPSSNNEVPYDDLVEGFCDLMSSFKCLKSKHINLKKEHECSISKFDLVSNEKDKALLELKKAKNDLVIFDFSFNEEMNDLKRRVSCLSTTLSDCASHTHKLSNLCCKSNISKNDVVIPQPAHKQHKRIYHCKYCGRDGHIAMFCYNNVANLHSMSREPRMFAHMNP
jgi:hypothetical protein